MIQDLLSLEWWRVVWIPVLGTIIAWISTRRKSIEDRRVAQQDKLDQRQEKEMARQDTEIAELREDRDLGWDLARGMEQLAHDRRHAHLDVVGAYANLLRMVRAYLMGAIPRERLQQAADEAINHPPPEKVPQLRDVQRRSP
ncbi:hypothetical protein [Roseomonas mucosa]|uniref:hypothetical protein n=1 Tax=Roseomonas mucosa TaxID=207340 RepID=UPI0022484AF0|nr:hypothetical protein [Roseomonas mucosa]